MLRILRIVMFKKYWSRKIITQDSRERWQKIKIRFFNIFWDDAKMRCPNQICRLFICFDLVWANVNTGNECFDQSEFVLIWNLAQNSKVAPNICIIPPFFKKSYLYYMVFSNHTYLVRRWRGISIEKCRSKRPLKRKKTFCILGTFFLLILKKRSSRPDVSINFLQVYWRFFWIHSIGIRNNKGVKSISKSVFRQDYKTQMIGFEGPSISVSKLL